ncbi:MAG: hypothetical protein AAF483_17370 [Planctomycetota bacterium]
MVRNRFRNIKLDSKDIEKLINDAPEMLNGHLHHILVKLGRGKYSERIFALQEDLWTHGIDPFMGIEIFIYAPMKGVHGDKPVPYVIEQLEALFRFAPDTAEVLETRRRLGSEAQRGFDHLL